MKTIHDPLEFRRFCATSSDLGLVPTMGALHEGHLALVQASRRRDAVTAVSIFVNPTQFGPQEDFDRYPRTLESDCRQLEARGVQAVFAPNAEAMYPPGDATRIEVEGLSRRLCGASRPGHFRGVATVVYKLFALARPARAYFGQKDAAQVAVIRRMVRDLMLPVELIVCPIVRETDGLAMSSRNALLNPEERRAASALARALRRVGEVYAQGERAAAPLLAAARVVLAAEPFLRLDFFAAVDPDSLLPVEKVVPGTLFAVAAIAGTTRLIDNARVYANGSFSL